jgi:microcystin-dependent protein
MSDPYLAEIRIWANTYNPIGWAYCNGASLGITMNQALFAVMGTSFGGNSSVFLLPDLRIKAPMGVGTGSGLTPRQFAYPYGETSVTLGVSQIPSHVHTLSAVVEKAKNATPDNTMYTSIGNNSTSTKAVKAYCAAATATSLVPMSAASLPTSGQGLAHNNMQPFLSIIYCIAVEGVFPVKP